MCVFVGLGQIAALVLIKWNYFVICDQEMPDTVDLLGLSHKQFMSLWWRHQMETFSVLLAICVGNSLVNSPHKG